MQTCARPGGMSSPMRRAVSSSPMNMQYELTRGSESRASARFIGDTLSAAIWTNQIHRRALSHTERPGGRTLLQHRIGQEENEVVVAWLLCDLLHSSNRGRQSVITRLDVGHMLVDAIDHVKSRLAVTWRR